MVALLLLSFGCIGGEKGKPTVIVEEKEEQPEVAPDEGNVSEEQPSQGEVVELSPPEIYFFNVSSSAPLRVDLLPERDATLSSRPKDGRLILIKSGEEELVVWSVPEERFEDAVALLEEHVDGPIEYIMFPSGYPTTAETAGRALEELDVEEVLVPHYNSRVLKVNGTRLKAGDEVEVGNITLRILSPIPGRLPGEEGNSITFEVEGKRPVLFLLDANPALVSVLYSEYREELRGWALELPLYGRGVGSYPIALNLFREYGAEFFVVEGAPIDFSLPDPVEDRAVLNFLWDVLRKPVYAVWKGPVHILPETAEVEGKTVSRHG